MRILSFCLVSLCLASSAFAQLGNCANAYWANSLRCQAFPLQVPQPNYGSAPANAGDVKTFTRVFLNFDPDIRCADGTRPVMYVDPAVGGASNNWVFSFTGGGAVAAEDLNADGIPDTAQDVVDVYADPAERDEMGTAFEPPMKELAGINNPDSARNPTFSAYNRVRIEKCGYDRFMGRASYQAAGGFFAGTWPPSGAAINYDLYQQGYLIIEEALQALSAGFSYTTWSVDPVTGNVVSSAEALPPLVDAEEVLFVGHSGGAHGLYHNIDNLAATFATYAPNADVRALFDANFLPSNENEAWFDSLAPMVNDAYSGVWAGQTAATDNSFTYDGNTYWPGGPFEMQYDMLDAELDASCLTAHPADGWKCTDRFHVLLNHIATPYFIREDFTDPNPEHTNGGAGHQLLWADAGFFAHCPSQLIPCLPRLTVAEYRERLEEQFQTLLDDSPFRSELATGADPSLGAGNYPNISVWMPQCGVHEGSYSEDAFFDTTMDYIGFVYSMDMFLRDFMSGPRTGGRSWYVDGWTDSLGNVQTTLTCN